MRLVACGAPGDEGVAIRLTDAPQTAADFLTDSREVLDWPITQNETNLGPDKTGSKVLGSALDS